MNVDNEISDVDECLFIIMCKRLAETLFVFCPKRGQGKQRYKNDWHRIENCIQDKKGRVDKNRSVCALRYSKSWPPWPPSIHHPLILKFYSHTTIFSI